MTIESFEKAINAGFGSAILELKALKESKQNDELEKYRDAVLYACMNDTRYDHQCEPERVQYRYDAIQFFDDQQYFVEKVHERLLAIADDKLFDMFEYSYALQFLQFLTGNEYLDYEKFLEEHSGWAGWTMEIDESQPPPPDYTYDCDGFIEKCRSGKINRGYARVLSRNLTPPDVERIYMLSCETDDMLVKTNLLTMFMFFPYLDDINVMIDLYDKADESSKRNLLEIFAKYQHERIYQIAVHNLENRIFIYESVDILKENFHDDYALLYDILKFDGEDIDSFHWTAYRVLDIFENRSFSESEIRILLEIYDKTPCTNCRGKAVEIMCREKMIPETILREAIYDCHDKTREAARNYENCIDNI